MMSRKRKSRKDNQVQNSPLLYHKTKEEIEAYLQKPVALKLRWLES
jgi:hypothetical protein